ncbi:glycosyltransferase family 2 protein [Tautonia plasticadhaerens]|uniref:N-acetylglucosaminyl-diphospho-decaprenol L-rhamnosyltransferase n=1 Tax=Tautonia plasticadhaerens TaxID=2527974 RepID=A0A518H7J6_9BACT|nr:glycosyltransferase family 2 protein [Tautonia plasticadhaerens]QDV36746.1 N-acetylglucosaminyl-diphospho-decaprenol L-rhamnosyltransferase [Tautonia plasticadhaerens]
MSRPTLSVVIPTHDGKALLAPCLASLRRHRPGGIDLDVIVVDDASADGSAEWVEAHHPEARVLRLGRNGGFCAAANAGVAASRGEFIQLLNNDAEVCDGWAEAGLAPFRAPRVGSVAPLVLVRSDPTRVDSAGDCYAFFGWPGKRGHGQPAGRWADRPDEEVFGASASSAFYRAEAIRRAGAFDPSYGSYYEDVDLAFRLRWAGYTCVFSSGSRILHDVSATYDHGRPELHRRMSRNAEVLFWSNLPVGWLAAALVPHLAFLGIQLAWKASKGRAMPFLMGKFDAIGSLHRSLALRSHRRELARSAASPPAFRMGVAPIRAAVDHVSGPIRAAGACAEA